MAVRPGHILCEDGSTVPYEMHDKTREKAIAVVFDTGTHDGHKGIGYAVYLWEFKEQAFADSLGIEQGTSANTDAYDGNANTFALYDTNETASPMAESVLDMWRYGQSAFIPSVAEMRLLYTARQKDSVLTLDVPAGSATFRTTVQDMQTLLNEGVSTLVVQTEKGSTTLNLSLLVEGQKGTDRVVLRRLGENTFLTVGLRCRRDLIVGR